MGEVDGLPVEGFDFGNSPSKLVGHDLAGKQLIQHTIAGTQRVLRSTNAGTLLASSFVCAGATARFIQQRTPTSVIFAITGIAPGWNGDEDVARADHIAALLRGDRPDAAPFIQRVIDSDAGRALSDLVTPDYSWANLRCCTAVDRFDFAMLVEQLHGLFVMEKAGRRNG